MYEENTISDPSKDRTFKPYTTEITRVFKGRIAPEGHILLVVKVFNKGQAGYTL